MFRFYRLNVQKSPAKNKTEILVILSGSTQFVDAACKYLLRKSCSPLQYAPKAGILCQGLGRNVPPTQDMGMSPQENTMNYATIKYCDIANGEGVRTSLFVSGCRRHCPNCFNAVAWDFGYGAPFTKEVRNEILGKYWPPVNINGLSLLGGEPFEPENQRSCCPLLKCKVLYPNKTIWCYTGNNLEHEIWQPGPGRMRGHRRVFTIYRCACGRRLCAGPVRHQSALPRVEQPAHH